MAWFAELKRRQWYCIVGLKMNNVYKKKLYDDWYASLTDEQKDRLEQHRQKKREQNERELQDIFNRLSIMSSCIANAYASSDSRIPYSDFVKLCK